MSEATSWDPGAAQHQGTRTFQADAHSLAQDETNGRLGVAVTDGIGDTEAAAFVAGLAAETAATTTLASTPGLGCVAARDQRTAHYGQHAPDRDVRVEEADASIVVALLDPRHSRVLLAWAGICRAYVLDTSGRLQRATYDHSLGEHIRRRTTQRGPLRAYDRVVTRTVARREFVTTSLPAHTIRSVLLCTDGVTRRLTDQVIVGALRQDDPQKAADYLATSAGLNGPDNATAVVIHRLPATQ